MGCCGGREKFGSATNEQRWDFINLSDFKSTSCWTGFSYGVLYFFLIISIAVYVVDIYTAANLLFFDRWSSQVKPVIPFQVSRWVFAGCIFLSWILLAHRWWRALRAMKSGIITASYLDPLAVRIESIRWGKGQGWRRFLVFTALTKGRKGSEYVALFTYFSFEAWLRIIFAEGPRQVINALTLYSVLRLKLIPTGEHAPSEGHTAAVQFFINVKILANSNVQQATILFGMLYVLIVWLFTAISLFISFIMYITFLWHHIPSADGSLSKFCQRKIEKRLGQIVMARVDKAIAQEHLDRVKKVATGGAGASVGMPSQQMDVKRQPTIPDLNCASVVPTLSNLNTRTSTDSRPASPFGTRPASPFIDRPESPRPGPPRSALSREPMLPGITSDGSRPGPPVRNTTKSSIHSDSSYASDAPLMGGAADMGNSRPRRHSPPNVYSRTGSERSAASNPRSIPRSFTDSSQTTQRSGPPGRGPHGGPPRLNTGANGRPMGPVIQNVGSGPMSRGPASATLPGSPLRQPGPTNFSRRPTQEFEMHPPTPSGGRNLSGGMDYFGERNVPPRAGTAPAMHASPGYDDSIYDAYGARAVPSAQAYLPARPGTAGPGPRPSGGDRRNGSSGYQPYNPPRF